MNVGGGVYTLWKTGFIPSLQHFIRFPVAFHFVWIRSAFETSVHVLFLILKFISFHFISCIVISCFVFQPLLFFLGIFQLLIFFSFYAWIMPRGVRGSAKKKPREFSVDLRTCERKRGIRVRSKKYVSSISTFLSVNPSSRTRQPSKRITKRFGTRAETVEWSCSPRLPLFVILGREMMATSGTAEDWPNIASERNVGRRWSDSARARMKILSKKGEDEDIVKESYMLHVRFHVFPNTHKLFTLISDLTIDTSYIS